MSHPSANPRSLLSNETRQLIDRIHRAGRPPMQAMTPEQARAFYETGAPLLDVPPPAVPRVEDFTIPARDGHAIPARLYAPDHDAKLHGPHGVPVLLYVHGGGFTIGSIATHDVLCRQLSRLAHCAVVSLDYRLAPEHRFPTAVNDAWDALVWLHEHGQVMGLDSSRMAMGGDSAGGTLTAVCAHLARDAQLPLALQLLFYPGTTAHQDTPSHQTFAHGFMLDKETVDWFFAHYIDYADRDDWRFAPLNAPDHAGLAPAWIGLAECDPLVDEGLRYADVLRMAGVPVDLELYRGVIHGFVTMGRTIPQALQAHADAARALRQAFGLSPAPEMRLGTWAQLKALAQPLRTEVFVQEQGVDASEEWDEFDETALHAVLVNTHGHPVATGRLLQPEPGVGQIGRMAVARAKRGHGFGAHILQALMSQAQARGDHTLVLHAQRHAEGFYARVGFEPVGEPYEEAGMPHITMQRVIKPR
jgi:acetyl esterase